jgi:hypothetical protein
MFSPGAMSGLFEATGGGIDGSQHGIFARDLGPCVPNTVIGPHSAEKSRVLASYDMGYFRSLLT